MKNTVMPPVPVNLARATAWLVLIFGFVGALLLLFTDLLVRLFYVLDVLLESAWQKVAGHQ